jgi:glucosamine--fructose-6-phosphate aminotransferase (isomerizing)
VSIDSGTLVVVIAGPAASSERTRTLLKASHDLGAKTMVVTDSEFDADYTLRFPRTHEYLTPFLSIIPLYFFSYFLAVKKGHNPDYLRYLDQRYWDARQIIFPPGTH